MEHVHTLDWAAKPSSSKFTAGSAYPAWCPIAGNEVLLRTGRCGSRVRHWYRKSFKRHRSSNFRLLREPERVETTFYVALWGTLRERERGPISSWSSSWSSVARHVAEDLYNSCPWFVSVCWARCLHRKNVRPGQKDYTAFNQTPSNVFKCRTHDKECCDAIDDLDWVHWHALI